MDAIAMPKNNFLRLLFTDLSAWTLLFSNLFVIYIAISEHWPLITIMLAYWCQSIIVGIFNFIRILTLKDFSVENFRISGRNATPGTGTKLFTAFFFAMHYGIFHLVYLLFITSGMLFGDFSGSAIKVDLSFVAITAGIFFLNHMFSFATNYAKDSAKKQNIGKIMFYPYARIIPMHLTILFGGMFFANSDTIILFLGLKTLADLIMHAIEHSQ